MADHQTQPAFSARRALRRFFLSAFVVVSFIAYALHKPSSSSDSTPPGNSSNPSAPVAQQADTPTDAAPSAAAAPQQDTAAIPTAAVSPTDPAQQPAAPTATATNTGTYKDGTYTGPEVDAYYGLVKVQAVIQQGKIANVQFLEYPNDRRTSVRINSYAVPTLQQEAVQAQNANVDIISGATLTSQAFSMSLQPALDQAKK
ncbi:MAG TPA: FMN-binding protein [Anaerolineaceae bacterium]|jgi:uncharacterized protein with FMN-binding domain